MPQQGHDLATRVPTICGFLASLIRAYESGSFSSEAFFLFPGLDCTLAFESLLYMFLPVTKLTYYTGLLSFVFALLSIDSSLRFCPLTSKHVSSQTRVREFYLEGWHIWYVNMDRTLLINRSLSCQTKRSFSAREVLAPYVALKSELWSILEPMRAL